MGVKVSSVPTDKGGMGSIQTALPMFIRREDCTNDECGGYFVCRDCRPADWREVDYAEDWIEIGVTNPGEALEWQMDPSLADSWIALSVDAEEAHAFDDLGIDPDDALVWINLGVDGRNLREICRKLGSLGSDTEEALGAAQRWVTAGGSLTDDDAELYIAAGVGPDERGHISMDGVRFLAGLGGGNSTVKSAEPST